MSAWMEEEGLPDLCIAESYSKQWLCIMSGGGGVGNSSIFHVLCHDRFIWHIMYNNGSYTESRFNSHFK